MDVFPGEDIILVLRGAVEEFQQDPMMEYPELDGGIAADARNPPVERDRLPVLPDLIYNVSRASTKSDGACFVWAAMIKHPRTVYYRSQPIDYTAAL